VEDTPANRRELTHLSGIRQSNSAACNAGRRPALNQESDVVRGRDGGRGNHFMPAGGAPGEFHLPVFGKSTQCERAAQ
jgi:hypothetical protein